MILMLVGLLSAAACAVVMRRMLRARRERRFAAQFRQSLQVLVHALRVGVGFLQALERASRESAEPLASEWRLVLGGVGVGQPLGDALADLARRRPFKEVVWFVTAVQITQASGGSLGDVLETLATALQEKEMFREKVSALTAQGKASGALLSLLPFALLGALHLVAPELVSPLFSTAAGQWVLAGVVGSVCVGGLLIKKIVTIPME